MQTWINFPSSSSHYKKRTDCATPRFTRNDDYYTPYLVGETSQPMEKDARKRMEYYKKLAFPRSHKKSQCL